MTKDEWYRQLFERLDNSRFRSSFHLKQKDIDYINEKGLDTIRQHAKDFIAKREAPAYIANDGKQTPMKGHPVFIAQHATATCCRECIRKWHKMQPGKELSQVQQDYLVDVIMTWIQKEMENAKRVAFLYNSSEQNSKFQVDIARKKAEEIGLTTRDATITNPNEIQQIVQNLVGKVDAIYVPTDNMVSAGMPTVISITEPAKIPVICGEEGMLKAGGLATYGINYYELGKLTSKQAVKILKGESKPADMPIEYLENLTLKVNIEAAQKLNITIPNDL
mgnify:CR=1 FL=1